ncbi:MAG: glycosyltransferase family 2 protein [Acidobacteria bacterium]|nr:MAG: glycosyltransferase family 2 protein [Acidobacteriota bacterium]
MELTVVIPCRDGGTRLEETLDALAAARPPAGGMEVVVSDDGSRPPLAPRPRPGLPIRVVRSETPRGRAAACNRGLEAAAGRVVLVLDDDMTVSPETPAGHAGAHREELPPRAVVGRIDPDPRCFRGPFGRFLAEEERRRHDRLAARREDVAYTDCLTGHFSVLRRVLRDAGGYDEGFTGYGLEDIELAFRLRRAGVPIVYRPELAARHRSAHAGFREHCLRHLEVGAMAVRFARAHDDPGVRAFLRVDGMDPRAEPSRFRRAMARAHRLVRRSPAGLRPLLLLGGRAAAGVLGVTGPVKLRHAVYHMVRDMHFAAGVAGALERGRST